GNNQPARKKISGFPVRLMNLHLYSRSSFRPVLGGPSFAESLIRTVLARIEYITMKRGYWPKPYRMRSAGEASRFSEEVSTGPSCQRAHSCRRIEDSAGLSRRLRGVHLAAES